MEPSPQLNDTPAPNSPVISSAPVEPNPVVVQSLPPKKLRKKLIAVIIISSVVVVIAALFVTGIILKNSADEAARQYKTDVSAHVSDLLTSPTPEARAKSFEKTVQLKDVPFGDILSPSYKVAKEFSGGYTAFIQEGLPAMRARFATLDLSPFILTVTGLLDQKLAIEMPNITDEASAKRIGDNIASLRAKGEGFQAASERFAKYEYDEKYKASQKDIATTLRAMGETWLKIAAVQEEIGDKQVEALELKAKGDDIGYSSANLEITLLITASQAKVAQIVKDHPTDYGAKLLAFTKLLAADKYIESTADHARELQVRAQTLKSDIEKMKIN